MNKIISTNKKVLGFSFLAWIVPFVVSIFMVDPVTKEYLPNFTIFKAVMFVILAVVTYGLYTSLKKVQLLTIATPNTFLLVNILLDLFVLILAFQIPILVWVTTVLPVYLIVFYGGFYLKK
jgi:hypothetical protein